MKYRNILTMQQSNEEIICWTKTTTIMIIKNRAYWNRISIWQYKVGQSSKGKREEWRDFMIVELLIDSWNFCLLLSAWFNSQKSFERIIHFRKKKKTFELFCKLEKLFFEQRVVFAWDQCDQVGLIFEICLGNKSSYTFSIHTDAFIAVSCCI